MNLPTTLVGFDGTDGADSNGSPVCAGKSDRMGATFHASRATSGGALSDSLTPAPYPLQPVPAG